MTQPSIETLQSITTNKGQDLYSLSCGSPVLLVFLRRFGCVFCQEALHELRDLRERIEARGVRIVLVHMGIEAEGDEYFSNMEMTDIDHVSDVDCQYYKAFGLTKARFSQLYGLQIWLRTAEAARNGSKIFTKSIGDGFQMPGLFFIKSGEVMSEFIHKLASDRPDYMALIS